MADTSERIIILSAVVLVILLWLPNSGLMRPLGTVFDIEIEITTSRDSYTLGESFTATLHFVNNGSKDVWMNPISELPFLGNSVNDPEPTTGAIHLDWIQGAKIHVPPKSKTQLFVLDFKPQYSGEFIISCFGVKKSVLILDPPSEGELVSVMMNKHSFMNTDKATLFITNYGIHNLEWGSRYLIEKEVDQNWIEVSFPSSWVWTPHIEPED
jgi:hypothetical protein